MVGGTGFAVIPAIFSEYAWSRAVRQAVLFAKSVYRCRRTDWVPDFAKLLDRKGKLTLNA
jgi:hypothetical protein